MNFSVEDALKRLLDAKATKELDNVKFVKQDMTFKVDYVFHMESQRNFVHHPLSFLEMEIALFKDAKPFMIMDVQNVMMDLVFYQTEDVKREGLEAVQLIIPVEIVKYA